MADKLTHEKRFASLGEMLDFGMKAPAMPGWSSQHSRTGDESFTGTKSWEEALRFARDGWPEGRAKMLKTVASAQSAGIIGVAPSFEMDVGGAYPIPALAAAGQPDCMLNFSPINERARPIVRLAISGSVSGRYPASAIFNYGAAILAYVDALEANDFQCEITWHFVAERDGKYGHLSVVAKQAGESLDLDRLAFVLASPSMLRRVSFAAQERTHSSDWQGGYGVPREPIRGLDFDESTIMLPSVQMFSISDPALNNPHELLKQMAPKIDALLRDRYADFPPLRFDGMMRDDERQAA